MSVAEPPAPGGAARELAPPSEPGARAGAEPGVLDRGVTEIADRVVEKLAARLADEVDGVVPDQPVGGLRGALPGRLGGAGTMARADAGRRSARVTLTLDVRYPQPVAEVSDQVRDHVIGGLHRLTGLDVESLEITVRRFVVGDRSGRRRVV